MNFLFLFIVVLSASFSNSYAGPIQILENELIKNSFEYSTQRESYDFSRKQIADAYLELFPEIGYSQTHNFDPITQDVVFSSSVGASLDVIKTINSYAEISKNITRSKMLDIENSIKIIEIKKKFRTSLLDLTLKHSVLNRYSNLLKIEKDNFLKIKKKFSVGAISKLDYFRSQNSIDDISYTIQKLKTDFSNEKSTFIANYKADEIQINEILSSSKVSVDVVSKYLEKLNDQLNTADTKHSLEYKSANLKSNLRALEKYSAFYGYLPKVFASANKDLRSEQTTYSMNFSFQLGTAVRDSSHFENAAYQLKTSSLETESLERMDRLTNTTLKNRISITLENLSYQLKLSERSKKIMDLSSDAYSNGKIDSSSYLADRKSFERSAIEVINSLFEAKKLIVEAEAYLAIDSEGLFL